jgi:hypothetical protein
MGRMNKNKNKNNYSAAYYLAKENYDKNMFHFAFVAVESGRYICEQKIAAILKGEIKND